MGFQLRRQDETERRWLTYGLPGLGAVAIIGACAIWRSATPTTAHSVLLILGCELVIGGLIAGTPRRAAVEDVTAFVSRCLVEAVFCSAFAYSAVIFVFSQSKPSERLGYFLTALVVVPISVVLSHRVPNAPEDLRRYRSESVILLALTALAICGARVWGHQHVSLKLVAFLVIARTLTALASRTGLSGWVSLPVGRSIAIASVLLAVTVLPFVASGDLTFFNLAYPVIVAIAIGWVAMRPRRTSTATRWAIDAVVSAATVLVVFQVVAPDAATLANGNYFLGPALDINHGHPMLVETFSQYGVGMMDALAGIFSVFTIGYGQFQLVLSTLTALLWVVMFAVLRLTTRSQVIATVGVAVGMLFYVFGSLGLFTDYPSTGVLRFGMPWLVVLLSVLSARVRDDRVRRLLDGGVLVVVAVAAQWSGEAGIYCAGTAFAVVCLDAAAVSAPLRERIRRAAFPLLRLVGAYVLGILLFTVITRLGTGRWLRWGPYLDFIRLYTTGNFGAEAVSRWSPGLAIGSAYAASAAALLGLVVARPAAIQARLPAFRAAAALTALGALVYTYFLGRSDPNNLVHVSPPFVALVFVWLGIANTVVDARWVAAVAVASVTFVGALLIAAERTPIDLRFRYTALGTLVEHPERFGDDLRTLKDNPAVFPQSVQVANYVRSLHIGRRPLMLLTQPMYDTEALLRLREANAVGSSNPCQEEISPSGASRLLTAVQHLNPGGVLVTIIGPTYGPLTALQNYEQKLLVSRFNLRPLRPSGDGLVAYSLGAVRSVWGGGLSYAHDEPPPVKVPSPGCA
jgi:hypothetical protein